MVHHLETEQSTESPVTSRATAPAASVLVVQPVPESSLIPLSSVSIAAVINEVKETIIRNSADGESEKMDAVQAKVFATMKVTAASAS